jgi:hypothetical protein
MMMNAQFVYTKQSVSPMLFRPEVLGTETPVTLGGHSGQVCLPRLDSTADDKGFHHMLAPVNLGVGVLPLVYDRRDPISWGRQIVSPGCESIIGACLFEFELAKVDLKARDQMAEIERCVDLWFGLVRDWVEVTTNQDLSIDEPLSGTANDVNYEWSWLARTTWRSTIASSFMGRNLHAGSLNCYHTTKLAEGSSVRQSRQTAARTSSTSQRCKSKIQEKSVQLFRNICRHRS